VCVCVCVCVWCVCVCVVCVCGEGECVNEVQAMCVQVCKASLILATGRQNQRQYVCGMQLGSKGCGRRG